MTPEEMREHAEELRTRGMTYQTAAAGHLYKSLAALWFELADMREQQEQKDATPTDRGSVPTK